MENKENSKIVTEEQTLLVSDEMKEGKVKMAKNENKAKIDQPFSSDEELKKTIKQSKTKAVVTRIVILLFLFVLAITVLFPFYWMVNSSLKTLDEYNEVIPTLWPRKVMWSNYLEAFKTGQLGYLFVNTLYVGIVSTLLSLVITILSAFAFARLEFPGRDTIFAGLLATMMIPGEMFTITNYATVKSVDKLFADLFSKAVMNGDPTGGIFGRIDKNQIQKNLSSISPLKNLLLNLNINAKGIWTEVMTKAPKYTSITFSNTYSALIIPFLVSIFYIYLLRQNFKQIPNELYLAAKVDGTSDFGYLMKVMIPLSAPTLVTITILKMMGAWNSYVWPRLITESDGMKLITNGIRDLDFSDPDRQDLVNYPLQMAAITLVTIPLFLVFLLFRKYIMRGVSKSGTKG